MDKVIHGDYCNSLIIQKDGNLIIKYKSEEIPLNQKTIDSYEVSNDRATVQTGSVLGRGLVGSLVLGPLGAIMGAASAF